MQVLIAMDSFKGSLSAYEAGEAVAAGLKQACAAFIPHEPCTCVNLPLADGGEGLIDCLRTRLLAQGFSEVKLAVHRANITAPEVTASMLVRGQECFIESAQALGLPLIAPDARTIMRASSYGLGQMISKALELGCTDIKIGLGGSATNDLGLGMAQALGVKFEGPALSEPITEVEAWHQITALDDRKLQQRLKGCTITLLSDVTNPLLGPQGATYVFSKQKGASPEEQERLEAALSAGAQLLTKHYGCDMSKVPGAGAAGGLGAALMYLAQAHCVSGIESVLAITGFEDELRNSDLVITGEGNLDLQTLGGKGPMGVATRAQAYQVPVIVLCGGMDATIPTERLRALGITACFSIAPGPISLEQSMQQAKQLLTSSAYHIMSAALAGLGTYQKKLCQ